jgi:hypothetical protein
VTPVQPRSTVLSCFDYSGFESFKLLCTRFSWSDFTQKTQLLDMCLTLDLTTSIFFRSLGFKSFNSCALVPPGVISPKKSDLSPPVALDDGRSLFTSKIWDFDESTLLHTQELSLVYLPSDPLVVGPLCSNLMVWVCSSPLHFLRSLGVDRTIEISSSTTNMTIVVARPPKILASSDLEYFCQCSKVLIFELSSSNPNCLGLACALKRTISFEF